MNLERINKWVYDYVGEITTIVIVLWIFATGFDPRMLCLTKWFLGWIGLMAVLRIIIRWKENRKQAK